MVCIDVAVTGIAQAAKHVHGDPPRRANDAAAEQDLPPPSAHCVGRQLWCRYRRHGEAPFAEKHSTADGVGEGAGSRLVADGGAKTRNRPSYLRLTIAPQDGGWRNEATTRGEKPFTRCVESAGGRRRDMSDCSGAEI
jgi:hypothetical protein